MIASKRGEHASWKRTVSYSAVCSLLFLAFALYAPLDHLLVRQGGEQVMTSILGGFGLASPLTLAILAYVVALTVLYLLVGLVACVLAWLTLIAWPSLNATRQSLMVLWFIALALLIVLLSAALYPRTLLADHYHATATLRLGPFALFKLLAWTMVAAAAFLAARAGLGSGNLMRQRRVAVPIILATLGVTAAVMWPAGGSASRAAAPQRTQSTPHVVLISIDSLRTDLLAGFGGSGPLENVNAALLDAHLFRDTTTPLARTFPSWVSLLTGKHPRTTGAWFNLIAREHVAAHPTLADVLKSNGYQTVFATDEARFANIDHSYGFDHVLTPKIGATDFILGTLNDTPLTNLIANTAIGEWLFPDTFANRAAASRYLPEVFVERIRRNVRFERPTLLIVHLTASHWPYHVARQRSVAEDRSSDPFAEYLEGVEIADRQVGDILALLKDAGALDNAIVWFLSDHGEAMQRGDALLAQGDVDPGQAPIPVFAHGHGTSVLSPVQYQTLMAVKGYGPAGASIPKGISSVPASVEDLTPTTLDLLGFMKGNDYDGLSLRPILTAEPGAPEVFAARVRYTETDFSVPRMLAGEVNPGWIAMQGVQYYSVNPASGWVELKHDRLADLMRLKERAAIKGNALLAALPALDGRTLYVLADRTSGKHRVLEQPPPQDAGDAADLWKALHHRFPGELGEPRPLRLSADTRSDFVHSAVSTP